MQTRTVLCIGILTGLSTAWLAYQSGHGWLSVFFAYVGGGNLWLTIYYAFVLRIGGLTNWR